MKASRKGRRSNKRSYTPIVIVALVVVTGIVAYFIFEQSGAGGGSPLIGQAVPTGILDQLSGVSLDTMNAVGTNQNVNSPAATPSGSPALILNGKPGVIYMGAEYCPYCAAERWAMIVALDKFGNFSGIEYMQSSSTDVYPDTPTFTFKDATYTSNYITFQSVEQADRNDQPLQTATTNQTALLNKYDTSTGSIPFVDFGNQYVITGAQYLPTFMQNKNWTQIAAQLNNASSPVAQNIVGAANYLVAAICKIDGGSPSSVCTLGFAQTVSYLRSAASSQQLIASDAVFSVPASRSSGRLALS
ncbi:MAG TPA: DUF929 family protein [Nitrososphaerales archaeon]|nr:DUF929 family protein [Nitrososphaerales archaeon]